MSIRNSPNENLKTIAAYYGYKYRTFLRQVNEVIKTDPEFREKFGKKRNPLRLYQVEMILDEFGEKREES